MCFIPPPLAFHSIKGIQRQHAQYGGEQHEAHNPKVGEQPNARAAERERPDRIPPKRAVRQVERDHEHAQERQVFGVEERVGVQSRMQQKQQHGGQRDESAAEQPVRQQPGEESAREKEQVANQVSA